MGDRIDYQAVLREALRDAVRRVLAEVAEEGLPGEHYFYIGFRTDHPGVSIPRFLRDRYPTEMTIVLQSQFWALSVGAQSFSVMLSFNGTRHTLEIPWQALSTFVDPHADFALRFEGDAAASAEPVAQSPAHTPVQGLPPEPGPAGPTPVPAKPAGRAEVLPFDPSRRR